MYENGTREREYDSPGMVYGFFAGTGMFTMFLCLILVALFLTGCKSPSGPTDPPNNEPVKIVSDDIFLGINTEIQVYATGGDGQNYSWLVSGGGTISPMIPATRAILQAGSATGTFRISVSSGGSSDEIQFRVTPEYWVELVSVSVPNGGTVKKGQGVRITARYVVAQDGLGLSAYPADENKVPLSTRGSGPVLQSRRGEAQMGFVVKEEELKQHSHFIAIRITGRQGLILKSYFPYQIHWT